MVEISAGPAEPFSFPATSGEVPGTGPGSYCGYALSETAGAAATVTLYDSATGATGAILDVMSFTAHQPQSANYVRPGRQVKNGIYAQITGAVAGSIFQ
jgi:hypothetical protein